jgi:hypothetical protein
MPRKKRVGEKTRTIKVFESSAQLLEHMLSRRGTGTTFADVFQDILIEHYEDALNAVRQSADVVGAELDKLEAKREKERGSKQS